MTQIRAGHEADLPWLLEQLREFDAFFGAKHTLFPDETYGRSFLRSLIDQHVLLIASAEGPPASRIGFIGGLLGKHPFNPDLRTLTELFWWVVPRSRGGTTGARLLLEFRACAERHHVHMVVLSLEERTITEGMVDPSSLERMGFVPKERSYLLELEEALV